MLCNNVTLFFSPSLSVSFNSTHSFVMCSSLSFPSPLYFLFVLQYLLSISYFLIPSFKPCNHHCCPFSYLPTYLSLITNSFFINFSLSLILSISLHIRLSWFSPFLHLFVTSSNTLVVSCNIIFTLIFKLHHSLWSFHPLCLFCCFVSHFCGLYITMLFIKQSNIINFFFYNHFQTFSILFPIQLTLFARFANS